jgi:hypothetical protein
MDFLIGIGMAKNLRIESAQVIRFPFHEFIAHDERINLC